MEIEKPDLPIHQHRQEIIKMIRSSPVTIICGETGCGKTTQVPQYLFAQNLYKRVIVTQPRRISAITLAERVGEELGVNVGNEVGYSVRFQERRSDETKILFMTDGMAIRQMMIQRHFSVVILDEAHERSVNTDVLMALLRNRLIEQQSLLSQKKIKRLEFRLVIMSATIESSKFMDFFNTTSIIRVKGRTFPTRIHNLLQPTQNYLETAFNSALQTHMTQTQGDILIFLTGEDEILSLQKKFNKAIEDFNIKNLQIMIIYAALPHQFQHQIFSHHDRERRRIILATNIAETSITISGLRYVIDTGFMKIRVYDPIKAIDMLTVVPISKANALQRAGRAGRQFQGKCFRLYVKNDYDELPEQITPEILRSELSGPILQLKAIGVPKIKELQFMDQPSENTVDKCLKLLVDLKCINQQEKITQYGRQVSSIPLVPYLSNLLIKSYEYKCPQIMLSVLSILSIDNLFYTKSGKNQATAAAQLLQNLKKYTPIVQGNKIMSDHLAKALILQEYIMSNNKKSFCNVNFLNKNNIKRAVLIRQQLQQYLLMILKQRQKRQFFRAHEKKQEVNLKISHKFVSENIRSWMKCMENCSPNNIAKLNKNGSYMISTSGEPASIHPESLVFYKKPKPSLIVFHQVVKTSKLYLRDVTALQMPQ